MTATTTTSGGPDSHLKVIRRRQVVRAHSHRDSPAASPAAAPSSWWDAVASPPATLWALAATVLGLLLSPIRKLAVGRYPDRLHDFHEIPPFLCENPHILTNYRVHFRKRDCVRSMCRCHNETLNIFTHSCGFALLGALGWRTWVWLEQQHSSSGDELAFALYFLSVLYCMAASTAYHTFGCHSMTMFRSLLTHDICGVFVTIAVLELEISYFLFHDHWGWMVFYWLFSLTGLTIIFPVIYNFSMLNFDTLSKADDTDTAKDGKAAPETHAVAKNADNYRMTCLVGITIALAQVAFMAFHVWFTKGFDSVYLQQAAWHVAQGVCAMALGVLFFAKRYPESSYPGKFDVLGHSHQIWHVGAVINLWEAYNCITQLYLYKQQSLAVA